jgi:hypothetical protein
VIPFLTEADLPPPDQEAVAALAEGRRQPPDEITVDENSFGAHADRVVALAPPAEPTV